MIRTLLAAAGKKAQLESGGPATIGWNPQVLGPGVIKGLWNPIGEPLSVVHTANAVDSVADLSGNLNDLETSGNQPTLNAGIIEIDHLNTEHMAATIDTAPAFGVGSIFLFAELGTADSFGRFVGAQLSANDTTNANYAAPMVSIGSNVQVYSNGAGRAFLPKPSGFNLIEIRLGPSQNEIWVNGAQAAVNATAAAVSLEQIVLGRGWTDAYGASLNWGCLSLVNGILAEEDRQKLEGWMLFQAGQQALLPSGHPYKTTIFQDPATYNPVDHFPMVWEYTAAKTGWLTEPGGGGETMFVNSPLLSIAESLSTPGLATGSQTGHSLNPATGWSLDDVNELLLINGFEIDLSFSRWNGVSEAGYAPLASNFLWVFVIKYGGTSNADTISGSSNLYPTCKLENVGGPRLKVNDNFFTNFDGTGTSLNQANFQWSPVPANGQLWMFGIYRDCHEADGVTASTRKYYFWHAPILAGNDRSNIGLLDSVGTTSAYIAPAARSETRSTATIRFDEETGVHAIIHSNERASFATMNDKIGDLYEYYIGKLAS